MQEPTEKLVYDLLEELQIPYERLDHVPITSVKGLEFTLPGQQVKNLLLKNKKGRQYYLVILHDEKSADLKQLAELLGESRLSFASEERMMETMKCVPGTVTPFGLLYDEELKVQVIVDKAVDQELTVGFHPFVNTTTLNIPFKDFVRFLEYVNHDFKVIEL